jgi:hypothetical protein
LPEETDENHEKRSVKIAGVLTEIRNLAPPEYEFGELPLSKLCSVIFCHVLTVKNEINVFYADVFIFFLPHCNLPPPSADIKNGGAIPPLPRVFMV